MGAAPVLAISPRRAYRYWRRNLDVFLATWKTTVLPPILEPILYLVAFGAGVGMLIGGIAYRGETVSYLAFVAPGMIAVGSLFWAFFEGTYSTFVRFRYQRTLEAVMSTPLTPEEILVGEILWAASKGLIAGLVTGSVVAALGLLSWPHALLLPAVLALGSVAFAALGVFCCGLVKSIDAINVPTFVFVMPMYLFSGTFFPLDVMPGWARAVAQLLPLTHLVNLVRALALGRLYASLWLDALALAATSAVFLPWAVALMRRKIVK